MDPVSIIMGGMAIAGTLTSIFGANDAADTSKQIYGISQQIAGVEQQENYQKYLAMVYQNNRQQMEMLRKAQQVRSAAQAASLNAGAFYGSGRKGGEAQTSAQAGWNTEGLSLSLQTGTALYNNANQISALQAQQAGLQGRIASDQGQIAIGNAITGAAGPIGRLGGEAWGAYNTWQKNQTDWNNFGY